MMAPYLYSGMHQPPRGWPYPFPYQWGYANIAAQPIDSAVVDPTQPLGCIPDSAASHTLVASAKTSTQTKLNARGADVSPEKPSQTAEPESVPLAIGVNNLDQQHRDEVMDMYLDTINHNRLSKAEAAIALALRRIFPDARFEKVRPKWLKNHTGRCLEIDLFCESLSLGIERQGIQHHVFPNGIHTSRAAFEALQERDKTKLDLCTKRGVCLIYVPFTVPAKDTETFLRDELRRLNFTPPAALPRR